jgi:hypothetical protein
MASKGQLKFKLAQTKWYRDSPGRKISGPYTSKNINQEISLLAHTGNCHGNWKINSVFRTKNPN